jgi:hypothetical protein
MSVNFSTMHALFQFVNPLIFCNFSRLGLFNFNLNGI